MRYGVRGPPLEWFSSYLNDRTKQVLCNNQLSGTLKINCGVPQGSILGPLLFLIYVNDFSSCITKGKTIMFADDTILFFSENWGVITGCSLSGLRARKLLGKKIFLADALFGIIGFAELTNSLGK